MEEKHIGLQGQAFGGMPKVSIDPTIWTPSGKFHATPETHPAPPSMEHFEIAFSATRRVCDVIQPVLRYVEVVKIRFRIGVDDPYAVCLRAELVLVNPITGEKVEFADAALVLETKPLKNPVYPLDREQNLASLATRLHVQVQDYVQGCMQSRKSKEAAMKQFCEAFK